MDKIWEFSAEMIRVVDGDTIDFRVDLGFRVFTLVRVRLAGIDTPEVYGVKKGSEEYERGQQATEMTKAWFAENGTHVELTTDKDPGKYGRWIGRVESPASGSVLNRVLHEAGYGRDYDAKG
jgi:micrococcal nuclease